MSAAWESRILLIEDDKDIREALVEFLEDSGFRVSTASDGHQALMQLRSGTPPCLVILDLLLPYMDGFELRREMLAEPRLAGIPVVVTTALSAEFRRENTLQALAYLSKPIDTGRLMELVRSQCG